VREAARRTECRNRLRIGAEINPAFEFGVDKFWKK
jgi:hypothetical protein